MAPPGAVERMVALSGVGHGRRESSSGPVVFGFVFVADVAEFPYLLAAFAVDGREPGC